MTLFSADSLNLPLDAFFRGQPLLRQIFDALRVLIDELDPAALAVTKLQVAFRRARAFAWAWMPGPPPALVLSAGQKLAGKAILNGERLAFSRLPPIAELAIMK